MKLIQFAIEISQFEYIEYDTGKKYFQFYEPTLKSALQQLCYSAHNTLVIEFEIKSFNTYFLPNKLHQYIRKRLECTNQETKSTRKYIKRR